MIPLLPIALAAGGYYWWKRRSTIQAGGSQFQVDHNMPVNLQQSFINLMATNNDYSSLMANAASLKSMGYPIAAKLISDKAAIIQAQGTIVTSGIPSGASNHIHPNKFSIWGA